MAKDITLVRDITTVKKDRMRFVKNKISSTLCYIAILFNVLYFTNIYSSNNEYYYEANIGLSVVYNLLFLLFTFLCSEGVKNYSKGYSIFVFIIGVMQLVRICGIPMKAHQDPEVMGEEQFRLLICYLVISAACCIAAGIIGFVKTTILEKFKKETGLG